MPITNYSEKGTYIVPQILDPSEQCEKYDKYNLYRYLYLLGKILYTRNI